MLIFFSTIWIFPYPEYLYSQSIQTIEVLLYIITNDWLSKIFVENIKTYIQTISRSHKISIQINHQTTRKPAAEKNRCIMSSLMKYFNENTNRSHVITTKSQVCSRLDRGRKSRGEDLVRRSIRDLWWDAGVGRKPTIDDRTLNGVGFICLISSMDTRGDPASFGVEKRREFRIDALPAASFIASTKFESVCFAARRSKVTFFRRWNNKIEIRVVVCLSTRSFAKKSAMINGKICREKIVDPMKREYFEIAFMYI